MKWKGLSSFNIFELKFYKFIGIYTFQKVILFFEKIKHKKTNQLNENYHPSNFDIFSVDNFKVFLLLHVVLHTISLLFTYIYYLEILVMYEKNIVASVFVIILTLLNVYCILLQRTSYLRIKDYCHKYYKRFFSNKKKYIKKIVKNLYDKNNHLLKQDYEILCRIKKAFDGVNECFIKTSDIDSLNRIYKCAEVILPKKILIQESNTNFGNNFLEECNKISGLYSKWQLRIKWFQQFTIFSKTNMYTFSPIITENAKCEIYYRKLVPVDCIYYMCFLYFPIYEIYTEVIHEDKSNEA